MRAGLRIDICTKSPGPTIISIVTVPKHGDISSTKVVSSYIDLNGLRIDKLPVTQSDILIDNLQLLARASKLILESYKFFSESLCSISIDLD